MRPTASTAKCKRRACWHCWPLIVRLRVDLRCKLGEETYQAGWERGASQDLGTTIRSILGEEDQEKQEQHTTRKTANHSLLEPLSERELEVLSLIAQGLS